MRAAMRRKEIESFCNINEMKASLTKLEQFLHKVISSAV